MGAQSTEGTGLGIAKGPDGQPAKHKPGNNTGCGGGDPPEEVATPEVKRGCFVRHRSSGNTRYNSGGGSTGIKVC